MSNTTNELNEKTSFVDFKIDKREHIDDDMNKTVARNINSRSSIKSRKVINYLNHQYAVKYSRKICPIITVINKFKNIDTLNKMEDTVKDLNIKLIKLDECLNKCKKERNGKFNIDELSNKN